MEKVHYKWLREKKKSLGSIHVVNATFVINTEGKIENTQKLTNRGMFLRYGIIFSSSFV